MSEKADKVWLKTLNDINTTWSEFATKLVNEHFKESMTFLALGVILGVSIGIVIGISL